MHTDQLWYVITLGDKILSIQISNNKLAHRNTWLKPLHQSLNLFILTSNMSWPIGCGAIVIFKLSIPCKIDVINYEILFMDFIIRRNKIAVIKQGLWYIKVWYGYYLHAPIDNRAGDKLSYRQISVEKKFICNPLGY